MLQIQLQLDNKTINLDPLDNVTIPSCLDLNDTLQHQESQVNVSIEYDASIHKILVENNSIPVSVFEDGKKIFTGIIDSGLSWTDNGTPEPLNNISLVIYDNTYKLQNTAETPIAYINSSLTEIITKICKLCDLTYNDEGLLDAIQIPVFILNRDQEFYQAINDLLFEYGFAFGFTGTGDLTIINLKQTYDDQIIENLFTGVKFSRTKRKYTGIELNYGKITKKDNEQVYFEGGDLGEDNKIIPIIITPGTYYPFESDPRIESTEGQVYQEFASGYAETQTLYNGEKRYTRSKDTQLLYTENHKLIEDYSDNLTVDRTGFEYTQASVRFVNNSNTDAELKQLAIKATAYYRSPVQLIRGNGKKFKYDTKYIYDKDSANALAALMQQYFLGGNFKITFKTTQKLIPGQKTKINTGLSGIIADVIILSATKDIYSEIYDITALTEQNITLDEKKWQIQKSMTASQVLDRTEIDNITIQTITTEYYLSDSRTELIGGKWEKTPPTATTNKYIWTKTIYTYTNGRTEETNPVSISGEPGAAGKTFKLITSPYRQSETTLLSWATVGIDAGGWEVNSTSNLSVGDSVGIQCYNTTKSCDVIILGTITKINSNTNLNMISAGLLGNKGDNGATGSPTKDNLIKNSNFVKGAYSGGWRIWGSPSYLEIDPDSTFGQCVKCIFNATGLQGSGYLVNGVKAGATYTISCYFWNSNGASLTIGIHHRNSSGEIIAQSWLPSFTDGGSKWVRKEITITTVANTAQLFLIFGGDDITNNEKIAYWTNVKLEENNVATNWTLHPTEMKGPKGEDSLGFAVKLNASDLTTTATGTIFVSGYENSVQANVNGYVRYLGNKITVTKTALKPSNQFIGWIAIPATGGTPVLAYRTVAGQWKSISNGTSTDITGSNYIAIAEARFESSLKATASSVIEPIRLDVLGGNIRSIYWGKSSGNPAFSAVLVIGHFYLNTSNGNIYSYNGITWELNNATDLEMQCMTDLLEIAQSSSSIGTPTFINKLVAYTAFINKLLSKEVTIDASTFGYIKSSNFAVKQDEWIKEEASIPNKGFGIFAGENGVSSIGAVTMKGQLTYFFYSKIRQLYAQYFFCDEDIKTKNINVSGNIELAITKDAQTTLDLPSTYISEVNEGLNYKPISKYLKSGSLLLGGGLGYGMADNLKYINASSTTFDDAALVLGAMGSKTIGVGIIASAHSDTSGYVKFANGLIIQWKYASSGSSNTVSDKSITLPIYHSNTNYAYFLCPVGYIESANVNWNRWGLKKVNGNTVQFQNLISEGMYIITIGY